MTRYVALLRGVSPMNCRMADLKRSFEAAGFSEVKTLLSSGNVAFTASPEIVPILERKAEGAMPYYVERVFPTIIRPSTYLQALIERDHFSDFDFPSNAKRVITFLRRPNEKKIELPIERHEAKVLKVGSTEIFSVYVPNDKGPVFMSLLERTFGTEITTRTLETVKKCSVA